MIRSFGGAVPQVHPSAFLAGSAEVIGNVRIAKECSLWYHAVVRGDINTITIGERTNVQDGCLLHVRRGGGEADAGSLVIGSGVTIGHGAILHACRVAEHCLIGMGAIVLDNARINPYTLVAAGSVVRSGAEFEEGVLLAGVPARAVRKLTPAERLMIGESARSYVEYAKSCKDSHMEE